MVVVLVVLLLVVPTGVMAVVRGSPDLITSAPSNTFVVGESGVLNVTLTNRGDLEQGSRTNPSRNSRVTTARGVEATLDSGDAPVDVETGTRSIGQLPEGESPALPYRLTVDEDAEPGTYTMELTVEYTYTSVVSELNGGENTRSVTRTFDVGVEIEDRARFEVVDTGSDARIGASGTVSLTVENVGTEAADAATVALESRNTAITFGESSSGSRFVGDWGPGERRTVEYQVRTAPDAQRQRYAFSATATFEDAEGVTRQSEPLSLGITPDREQTFSVVETGSTVAVGDSGTVSVALRNDGPIAVGDATVSLDSRSSDVVFGNASSATRFVGDWAPNETRTVEYDVTATDGADTRNYALDATVAYEDADGDAATSQALSLGVTPEPERGFSLSGMESSLQVGKERTLDGTVTNDGATEAQDVVVRFTTQNQNLNPVGREYSVGTLGPGESADFEFAVEVSEAASEGPRQFSFVAEYRNDDGERRQSDDLLTRQPIAPSADEFAVERVNTSLQNGATSEITVRVTNTANETLSSISSKLFADDPISAEDDEAFVAELAPGESTTLTFSVSASGATAKDYPLSIDFQYDDADGDTLVSDTYRVPVTVEEREEGGGPPLLLIGVVVVALVLGVAGYRYR